MSLFRLVPLLILCTAVAACSSTRSSTRIDYKKAATEAPLDMPPAMKAPVVGPDGVEVPADAASPESALLPRASDVRVVRYRDVRWLVVKDSAEDLWPRVHEFWKKQGLEILKDDPRVGVLETQWAENRADIPESFFRGLVGKVAPNLYSAHTRDKYRLRLERGSEPGTTEIYLNHYGVEQVNRGEEIVWQPRPSDPELVAEMMSRLMLFLGVPEERAKAAAVVVQKGDEAAPRARLEGERLLVDESFARTWRLAGIALDRAGLVVEDLDRAKGIYYVRQSDLQQGEKKGWFSGWFGSDKAEEKRFRLRIQGDESASRIAALDDKGEPLPADAAKMILTRLQEQLR